MKDNNILNAECLHFCCAEMMTSLTQRAIVCYVVNTVFVTFNPVMSEPHMVWFAKTLLSASESITLVSKYQAKLLKSITVISYVCSKICKFKNKFKMMNLL